MLIAVSPARGGGPEVIGFYDPRTFSIQYIAADLTSGRCALIDPILDYDEKSGSTSTTSADAMLNMVRERGLTVQWVLDTHPHADHFSAAHYLKEQTGARTGIGARAVEMQRMWSRIYNLDEAFPCDGSQWDRLFEDRDRFEIGHLPCRVMLSPGHTLASVTYVVGEAAFIHDTLFMPDSGTARADFPGGDPRQLWRSIQEIVAMPDSTRLFCGHDYQPGGRNPVWESTVGEQKRFNKHLAAGMDEDAFAALRSARDRTLPMPKLILHALQVNVAGGRLPEPEADGRRYLKIPLDAFPNANWG
jgi:glyoxylase-like metal-dependent hydrolase (beta-lactamase superfamily II)